MDNIALPGLSTALTETDLLSTATSVSSSGALPTSASIPTALGAIPATLSLPPEIDPIAIPGIFQVPGIPEQQTTFSLRWTNRDASFDNEVGLFIADDSSGLVDGLLPGQDGYAAAALQSRTRQVLFGSGEQTGAWEDVTLTAGQHVVFYLIQDTNRDVWLENNPQNQEGSSVALFSLPAANPDGFDHVRVSTLDDDVWRFNWEDLWGGGDQDFDDVVFTLHEAGLKTPGNSDETVKAEFSWQARRAKYDNELGLFLVDDAEGRVGSLRPGDVGYGAAALAPERRRLVFASGQTGGATTQFTLPGNQYLGWYLIQDATTDEWLGHNPTNQPKQGPLAFFSYSVANPDGLHHVHYTDQKTLAWEDLTGGGDLDFDDLVFQYDFELGTVEPVIVLREESNFESLYQTELVIPEEPSVLTFSYANLQFDQTDPDFINDAFEVALVDAEGNSLVHTIPGERDAFFNATEGEAVVTAPGVTVDGTTVTLNLVGLVPGTEARLIFRLVNNDEDTLTQVELTNTGTLAAAPAGTRATVAVPTEQDTNPQAPLSEAEFEQLEDVSASLTVDYQQTSFNQETETLFTDVLVRNAGSYGVDGPIVVAIDNLSDPTVRVADADGVTPEGLPYYLVPVSDATLEPGTVTAALTLAFANTKGEQFTYDLVFLGALNQPPQITTEPNLEGVIGQRYQYDVDATDPNGDGLTYELLIAPEGMVIDPQTGLIEWAPTEVNRGTQSITVRVEDGRGGSAEQTYDLVVGDAPPNRPPVFVTAPVVDARVNTAYEYDADATDLDGDNLTYALVNGPEGMTIDPETGVVSWEPTPEQIAAEEETPADLIFPVIQGFNIESYAETPESSPVELSFSPTGTLYVGSDARFHSGEDPIPVRRIQPGQNTWEVYGDSPIRDPDSVLFDQEGLVSGVPGSVIVGSFNQISAVYPDGTVGVIFSGSNLGNVESLVLDKTGRLLFSGVDENNSVLVSNGEEPEVLITSPVPVGHIAVDSQNRIYTSGQDGIIRVYDANGKLLNDAFTTGLASRFSIAFGPGGVWGSDLYAINAQSELVRIDEAGNQQVFATNIPSNTWDITFGPDNALYLSDADDDRILRISPDRETLGLAPSEHPVTITVADGQGGVAIQNYVVNVLPEDENRDPVIVSEPVVEISIPRQTSAKTWNYIDDFEFVLPQVGNGEDNAWFYYRAEAEDRDGIYNLFDAAGQGSFANDYGYWPPNNSHLVSSTFVHPGTFNFNNPTSNPEPDVIIGFRAPTTSSYQVSGLFRDFDGTDFDGPLNQRGVKIDISTTLTPGVANSDTTIPEFNTAFLDASNTNEALRTQLGNPEILPSEVNFDFDINLEEGQQLFFRVNDLGSNRFDTTGVEIDIKDTGINNAGKASTYQYDVDAIDPDNDTLTYSLVEAPDGMEINPDTGEIIWTPVLHTSSQDITDPIIIFGEDINPFNDENTTNETVTWLDDSPKANKAQAEFLSKLSDFKTENLDNYPRGTQSISTLNFGQDEPAATISGTYDINGGRDDNFYTFAPDDTNILILFGDTREFELEFNEPQGAFGFTAGDIQIIQLVLKFHHTDGTISEVKIPHALPSVAANEFYFGILNPENPFTKVTFVSQAPEGDESAPDRDAIAFDNFTIATPEQVRRLQSADVTVRVEDSRGGSDEQSFTIQIETSKTGVGEIQGTVFSGDPDGEIFESGLENVTVYLDSNNNGILDEDESIQVTNSDDPKTPNIDETGQYRFTNLLPGNYIVREVVPRGYALTFPLAPTSNENLLTNASFETGVSPGNFLPLNPGSEAITSWTVVQAQIDYIGTHWLSSDGSRSIDLDGTTGFGGIAQTFETIPGQKYLVTFDMAGNPSPQPRIKKMEVRAANQSAEFSFDVTGQNASNMGWQTKTFQFTATESSTTLEFRSLNTVSGFFGPALDNVRVQQLTSASFYTVALESGEIIQDLDFGNQFTGNIVTNTAPTFISDAPTFAQVGELFRYDANSRDVDGDLPIYDLSLAPEGMAIDKKTGIVVWEPTINQIGTHDIILRVQDGNGGVDLQAFQIIVSSNSAPTITSQPFGAAIVDSTYQYNALAEDADGDDLTFSLLDKPEGMVIDEQTGVITWNPTATDVGQYLIRLQVSDGQGGLDVQSFTLPVLASTDENRSPVILDSPRKAIGLGDDYLYQINAVDPDNDPLTYRLIEQPEGMTIDDNGLIVWPAEQTTLGEHSFTVQVEDGRGKGVQATYTLTVVQQTPNGAPTITSVPSFSATIGEFYSYDAEATDPDNDPLAWSLISGPEGLTLDETTGRVSWTPTEDQLGFHKVEIEVLDAQGASQTQGFGINVSSINAPPIITSAPPTLAFGGETYTYAIQAQDPNGNPLTYSLTVAPGGMTLDEKTGLIEWTPTPAQLGNQEVQFTVSDGRGGSIEQTYTINVASEVPNQPPVITSKPSFGATADQGYSYQITATDPENLTLRYVLLEGPAGMVIDETTGLLSWTPELAQVGEHTVKVAAFDPLKLGASQEFTLTVREANQQPVLNNRPETTVLIGETYAFDLNVTDPDGDAITYNLVNGPEGVTIDELGRLRWTPGSEDIGTARVDLEVRDDKGAGFTFGYNLSVIADTTAPQVAVEVSENPVDLNEPVTVQVTAVDDVAVDSVGLTVDGTAVPLNDQGQATLSFDVVGSVALVATALDTSGNAATTDFSLSVIDSLDTEAPLVELLSPTDGEAITSFADVIGTVTDDNLTGYTLTLTPFEGGPSRVLAQGTDEIEAGAIGQVDSTLLRNGSYILELSAQDAGGNTASTSTLVSAEGDLKVGNYTLSFVDLSIPLTGIPIVVSRTYDTLNANVQDDFGYGWSMGLRDTDLTDNVGKSGSEDIGLYNAFFDGAAVYVTLPNGEREKFIFQPEARGLPGFTFYKPKFVAADQDNTSTLTVDNIELRRTADGRYVTTSQIPYNPASTLISSTSSGNYTLTTRDGIRYTIDGDSGDLEQVTDRNGNTLTYRSDGVFSSTGQQVTFERDAQGRITAVIDPEGNRITYAYDALGDLVAVTDREGNTTRFDYDDNNPHYLDEILDPLGRQGIRSEYRDGRLVKLFDVEGNAVELIHDPENFVETVEDQLGNTTVYEYDARGNVLTEVDALGNITRRTYDNSDNVLTEAVEKDGTVFESTTFTYDSRNNILSEQNALGHITRFTYDSFGNVISTTDPTGQTVKNTYDSKGNLTQITGQATGPLALDYDAAGNLKSLTDAVGTTTFEYFADGNIRSKTDARGTVTRYTYDNNGNQLTETTTQTTPNGVVTLVTTMEYDDEGRLVKVIDPEGNTTETVYDANGNRIEEIDPLQRSTRYVYDERGQLIETIYPDATPKDLSDNPRTRTEYDAAGRVVAEIDELGRATRTIYDALGRVTETIYADDTPTDLSDNPRTRTEYDPAGRAIAQIDERNNRTEFVYDATGRLIETIYPDATPDELTDNPRFTTTYDDAGRQIAQTDALQQRTEFLYDGLGRSIGQKYADGTTSSVEYDDAGRVKAQTDQEGKTTRFEYDELGQLEAVVDALEQRTEYTYDEQGNLIAQKDARGNITRYEYDKLGRRIATVLPEQQRSVTLYDALGNPIQTTDFNGDNIIYAYDERYRLIRKDLPDEEFDEAYTYTDNGLLKTVTDARGITTYNYDERNRLTQRIDPDGRTIAYSYDDAENRTAVIIPSGTTDYTFDEQNRLQTVIDPDSGVTTYFYNAVGNLERTEFPNGTFEIRQYDSLNRLEYIENSGPNGIINSFRYTLNDAGHRTSVDEHDGRRVEYTYDDLYRLTKETIYDSGATEPSRTIEYVYDEVGNRLSRDDSAEGTTLYIYDNNDRLETAITDGVATTYSYDNNGNTISKTTDGTTITYNWNADNRLISADTDGDGIVDVVNQYNQNGIRVSQTVNGEETRFLIDENRPYDQVLEEYTPGGIIKVSYVYGNNLISQKREDESYIYHVDGLGSTRALTDITGNITNKYSYESYGQLITQIGTNKNSYLFAGEQRDFNLGFDYLRARYLSPNNGRFVSVDPFFGNLHDPISRHRYLYAHMNPVSMIDPSGESSINSQAITAGIIVGLASATFNVASTVLTTDRKELTFGVILGSAVEGFATGFIATELIVLGAPPPLAWAGTTAIVTLLSETSKGNFSISDEETNKAIMRIIFATILSGATTIGAGQAVGLIAPSERAIAQLLKDGATLASSALKKEIAKLAFVGAAQASISTAAQSILVNILVNKTTENAKKIQERYDKYDEILNPR